LTRGKFLRAARGLFGFVLALGLVGWVVARSGIDLGEVLATVDRPLFAAAFAIYGVGFLSASWRWYLLLEHIRVKLAFLTVLRLALIGLFFNLFVPGGVGGDLIKMVYLKKESGERYPQALLTVLLDRLLGLAGLLTLAVVALAMNREMLATSAPEMRGILAVVGIASAGGLVFLFAFLAWPWLSRWGGNLGASLTQRLPAGVISVAAKIGEALDLLRAAPGKLLFLLLLSTVGHLTAALGVYLVARGVGAGDELTFFECLLATQLANLVAAVPLTPGGLGGRDLVTSLLLREAGASVALAGAVPVLVSVLLISWSLVGGLALLWERGVGVAAGITENPSNP
jgi:uncharacterized protein (TIRG00374 family)